MYKIHAIVFSKVINVLQTNAHIKNAFTSNGNYCLIIILWYKGQTTQHINIKHIHILYTCFLLREIWKILSLILSFIFPTSEPDTSLRAQGFLQNVDTEQWQRRNFKKHPENILKEPIVTQKTTLSNYSSAFNLSWRLTYVSICSWWLSVYHQEVLRASSRFSWQRAPNLTPDSPSETAGWETAGKKEQHSFKKRKRKASHVEPL